MKKLQTFALLMLLSTGYITQARDQDDQGGKKRPKHSRNQGGQQGKRGQQGGRNQDAQRPMMSQEKIEEALGSSISFESVSDYAKLYADGISTLSASSQPEEIKSVMEKGRVIHEALRELLPKPEEGSMQDGQGQLPNDGGNSRSGRPMRGKKRPPMQDQADDSVDASENDAELQQFNS